jgi:hypothetical protein
MPAGDRTGPMGAGPMTGRRMGYCAGYPVPGYANPGFGWGRGFGRGYWGWGGGRGWRHWFYATGLPGWMRAGYSFAPPSREQELTWLKNESEWLKDQLDAINQRIAELEKKE